MNVLPSVSERYLAFELRGGFLLTDLAVNILLHHESNDRFGDGRALVGTGRWVAHIGTLTNVGPRSQEPCRRVSLAPTEVP